MTDDSDFRLLSANLDNFRTFFRKEVRFRTKVQENRTIQVHCIDFSPDGSSDMFVVPVTILMPGQVKLGQVKLSKDRSSKVGTGQVTLGQVKSSQNWSSQVKTGQVNLDQIKLSQVKSSWNRSSQVMASQVKLKNVNSVGPFFEPKSFGPQTFLSQILLDQKETIFCQPFIWTNILLTQIFYDPRFIMTQNSLDPIVF